MAQANVEGNVDRISSLPDSILAHILSFLPTNIAVSTCILLTRSRWRDIFPFSHNLDFDQSLLNDPKDTRLFIHFVNRFIKLNGTRVVDKFCLKCSNDVNTSRIHSWIRSALYRNARELDLSIGQRDFGKEYSHVLTSNTLVVLKLGPGFSLNVIASVYFPCLKILHLELIGSSQKPSPIQRLVSSCPVLEDLLLVGSYMENEVNLSSPSLKRFTIDKLSRSFYWPYKLVLDMPSLVYLRFTLFFGKANILKNLGSLREAHICIPDSNILGGHYELVEGLGNNVQSLYFSGKVEKFLRTLEVLEELPPLKNLTRLVLTGKPYLKKSVLRKLLQCCPNLEEFVTDGGIHGSRYDVPCSVPPRLKSIECALFYDGGSSTYKLVESLEYFLANANVLEKIHIRWHSLLSGREASKELETMMETMKKLVNTPSRSKPCEINISQCVE